MWTIRTPGETIGTGCVEGDRVEAEEGLRLYHRQADPKASRSAVIPCDSKLADRCRLHG